MNCTDDVKQQIKNSLCDDLSYLYEDLVNKKYSINNLNLWFNFYHNYVYEKKIRVEEREKRNDTNFKKQVKERYNNCCMITQKIPEVCEVAHIYPHSEANDNQKYDVDNGILLCKELHTLFDHPNYHMKINPETQQIEFSVYIMKSVPMSDYHKYNNTKVNLTPNNIVYLKMKYNK